ncbi:MAG TPA: hypothetical protein VD833_08835 [Vicinamibacterales bacterium]|nr:hypothetical protein [Vicinamibacterales bacterium]
MSHQELREIVNHHVCRMDGVDYRFHVLGIASEKGCEPSQARHIIDVECAAWRGIDGEARPFRLLVGVSQVGEVRGLLADALRQRLDESPAGASRHTRRRMKCSAASM